jgi:hypothetical protein
VPINCYCVPTKGSRARGIGIQIPLKFGRTTLSQTITVNDRYQIIQFVEGTLIKGLPDRTLSRFTITKQDPNAIRQLIQVFSSQSNANTNGETLSQ